MNIDTSVQGAAAAQATGSAGAASAIAGPAGTSSEQQDKFLRLLITQLKNQDPLNPLDSAQMTTQMAQMSSLQGIEQLNATLTSLAASLTGNQALQAATLVGHDVMAPGSAMQLVGGQGLAGVELAQAVDRLQVVISDASGTVVHRADLGPQAKGIVQIGWDGTTDSGAAAADGTYEVALTATAGGKNVSVNPLLFGRVQGVSAGSNGTTVNLGALGNIPLGQVKQYF